MPKKGLSAAQQVAIERVWQEGLTPVQIRVVNALDPWFDNHSRGPTLERLAVRSDASYDEVREALPILEFFRYLIVHRKDNGRLIPGGIILVTGFQDDCDELSSDNAPLVIAIYVFILLDGDVRCEWRAQNRAVTPMPTFWDEQVRWCIEVDFPGGWCE